jgi:hypothetical protein
MCCRCLSIRDVRHLTVIIEITLLLFDWKNDHQIIPINGKWLWIWLDEEKIQVPWGIWNSMKFVALSLAPHHFASWCRIDILSSPACCPKDYCALNKIGVLFPNKSKWKMDRPIACIADLTWIRNFATKRLKIDKPSPRMTQPDQYSGQICCWCLSIHDGQHLTVINGEVANFLIYDWKNSTPFFCQAFVALWSWQRKSSWLWTF